MSKLVRCPCCKQIIPPAAGPFETMPVKNRIYTFIARHPEGVTCHQIADHVYHGDLTKSANIIAVHVHHMRAELAAIGLEISVSRGREERRYRLKAVDNVNTVKSIFTLRRHGDGALCGVARSVA